jgi:hypothetical protein
MPAERREVPLEEPQAALERAFIDEYLRNNGPHPLVLQSMPPGEIRAVLREAALYAATKLAELEARAHYIHEIHGASNRG